MKWILMGVLVGATVLGDVLQSREMKSAGMGGQGVHGLWRVAKLIAARRYLLLGILCMAVSFFAFMALVQKEPISFVVPASAASFVLETILASIVLRERLSSRRSAGALLVVAGILLVAR